MPETMELEPCVLDDAGDVRPLATVIDRDPG
jgi:hypothetical protein